MNSIDIGKMKIEPFNFYEIREIEIEKKLNDHSVMNVKGVIKDDEGFSPVNTVTEGTAIKCINNGEVYFSGILQNVKVTKTSSDQYYLEIQAISNTILLDVVKRKRSFQNNSESYEEIMNNIIPENSGEVTSFNADVVNVENIILQYNETDWEFAKRLASHTQDVLIPVTSDTPAFHFGVPDKSGGVLNPTSYSRYKEFNLLRKMSSEHQPLGEDDVTFFTAETDNLVCDLGESLIVNGEILHVRHISISINEQVGSLKVVYTLSSKKAVVGPRIYNKELTGLVLNGDVLSVVGDTLRLSLYVYDTHTGDRIYIDDAQSIGNEHLFTYATGYSDENHTGWYVMPEINDVVQLFFPDENERNAYAVSSVRQSKTPRSIDPLQKFLRTSFGKEIKFDNDKILITSVDSSTFIRISASKGVEVMTPDQIKVTSRDATIDVTAGDDINVLTHKNMNITVKGNSNVIVKGNAHTTVHENAVVAVKGELNISSGKDMTISSGGNLNISAKEKISVHCPIELTLTEEASPNPLDPENDVKLLIPEPLVLPDLQKLKGSVIEMDPGSGITVATRQAAKIRSGAESSIFATGNAYINSSGTIMESTTSTMINSTCSTTITSGEHTKVTSCKHASIESLKGSILIKSKENTDIKSDRATKIVSKTNTNILSSFSTSIMSGIDTGIMSVGTTGITSGGTTGIASGIHTGISGLRSVKVDSTPDALSIIGTIASVSAAITKAVGNRVADDSAANNIIAAILKNFGSASSAVTGSALTSIAGASIAGITALCNVLVELTDLDCDEAIVCSEKAGLILGVAMAASKTLAKYDDSGIKVETHKSDVKIETKFGGNVKIETKSGGDIEIKSKENTKIDATGKAIIKSAEEIEIDAERKAHMKSKEADIEINSKANTNVISGGETKIDATGNTTIDCKAKVEIKSGGETKIDATGNTTIDCKAKVEVQSDANNGIELYSGKRNYVRLKSTVLNLSRGGTSIQLMGKRIVTEGASIEQN